MASIESIANEVKALVTDIKSDTSSIKTNTTAIKNDAVAIKTKADTIIAGVNQLDTDVKAGFSNLAQGIQVLIALGQQANGLLAVNNEQNETIICWLTNIANTVCDIKRNTDKEVALQTDIAATVHHVDDILELVHSHEAVEIANDKEIKDRLDECCPPKEEPVRPCFERCDSPQTPRFDPIITDWKPVRFGTQEPPR